MKSDAQIEATIRAKFARSKINAEKFTVHVQGGVATIEGKTNVIQHKGTATRLAKTGGAVAVNNHIEISDAAKQKAGRQSGSGPPRAQVKRGDARRSETDSARTRIRASGAVEFWIVDAETRTVVVHRKAGSMSVYGSDDSAPLPMFGSRIVLSELFAGL
jgi:hypothetical protein